MEERISFYLFQMPETFEASEKNIRTLLDFIPSLNLGNLAVLEFRHESWWKFTSEIEEIGSVFCSVDAPKLPREIIPMNDAVYLRLHGRKEWYSWVYSEEELRQIAEEILKIGSASKKYIFLNNDHGMIPNSKYLIERVSL